MGRHHRQKAHPNRVSKPSAERRRRAVGEERGEEIVLAHLIGRPAGFAQASTGIRDTTVNAIGGWMLRQAPMEPK